jgi:hypothetical protein
MLTLTASSGSAKIVADYGYPVVPIEYTSNGILAAPRCW